MPKSNWSTQDEPLVYLCICLFVFWDFVTFYFFVLAFFICFDFHILGIGYVFNRRRERENVIIEVE